MAVREPKHPLDKRELLHREPPDTKKINAIAQKLIDEGRTSEAVDYIEVTLDPGLIEAIGKQAHKQGSAFLLQQVERLSGSKASEEEWVTLSKTAGNAGRWLDAVRALMAAGRAEEAEALRLERCPDYDPFKPLGK